MPDITMCAASGCPLARTCYRSPDSGKQPNDKCQSWSLFRWTPADEHRSVNCRDWWPTKLLTASTTRAEVR